MKLAKWGNSLALRIPAEVVEQLKLAAGEELEIKVIGDNRLEIRRDQRRQQALEELKKLRVQLPENYVFRRSDTYDE
jgi:antitoxin MazE